MRYSPVGPVMVPASRRPAGSGIVGQPEAGVTRTGAAGGGGGLGVVAGGLLMTTLPLLPGEEMSSAPQPVRADRMAAVVIHCADFIFSIS
jgi:hypothetical protein